MDDSFNVSTEIGKVVTSFGTGMKDVASQGISLITTAAPYMIAVAGAVVIVSFGIKLVKKIRG